jgi:hypothetical protein
MYTMEIVLAREKNSRIMAKERWSFTVNPLEVVAVEVDMPTGLPTLANTKMVTIKPESITSTHKEEFLRALKSWVFKETPSILNNEFIAKWSVLAMVVRKYREDIPEEGEVTLGIPVSVKKFIADEEGRASWSMTPYSFTNEDQKRWKRHYLVDSV